MFGFMLCLFGVATLRWVSARELQQYQLRRHLPTSKSQISPSDDLDSGAVPPGETQPDESNIAVSGGDTERTAYNRMYSLRPIRPIDDHIRILNTVIALKKRGAAGGRHVDMRGKLSSLKGCSTSRFVTCLSPYLFIGNRGQPLFQTIVLPFSRLWL